MYSSQRLSHFSTVYNAGRLIFCVRDGYRSDPAAMAAVLNLCEMEWMKAKARIRTGMESLCRRLRSRSATLAHGSCAKRKIHRTQPSINFACFTGPCILLVLHT